MRDKLSIEYVRPEGLPEDAVPAVVFVAPAPSSHPDSILHAPNGQVAGLLGADWVERFGFPVPERTYEVTVRLTADEATAFLTSSSLEPQREQDRAATKSVEKKIVDAARTVLAAIEAGEA